MGILVDPVNKFRRIVIIEMNLVYVFVIRQEMKNFQPQKTSQVQRKVLRTDGPQPYIILLHEREHVGHRLDCVPDLPFCEIFLDAALDHEEVIEVEVVGEGE